jgi:hypothetical protein
MADDAMVFTASRAGELVRVTKKAVELVACVYRKFKLELIFNPGKSEAILAFRGVGAKEQNVALAVAGNSIAFDYGGPGETGEVRSLRVVHHYKHLGSICVVTGAIDMELRFRAGQALRALASIPTRCVSAFLCFLACSTALVLGRS